MPKRVITLQFQRETKGAILYGEQLANGKICQQPNEPGAFVGTQYVRKSGIEDGSVPPTLTVTYEW